MIDEVIVSDAGAMQVVSLNRPNAGNSLSASLVEALHARLDLLERASCRVLVLEGEGRNFCTGFDLKGVSDQSDGDLLHRFVRIEQLLGRLWTAAYTTVAVAKGSTQGAGADLFVACRHRIAVKGARFAFPGAGFGLVLGSRRLAARVGSDAARDLIASGGSITAEKAGELGLATEVVTESDLPASLARVLPAATRLDAETLAEVHAAIRHEVSDLDIDLAALVRSAARPGLGLRIQDYRARSLQAARSAKADPIDKAINDNP